MHYKLTKKQLEKIHQLKADGVSTTAIAKRFKVSRTTINYHTLQDCKAYAVNYRQTKKFKAYQKKYYLNKIK